MNDEVADAVVAHLLVERFDEGLTVTEAQVVGLPRNPVLVVRFEDAVRQPGGPQAAWWDVGAVEEFMGDAAAVASFAKAFLEELFNAGAPYEERPQDEAGVTWTPHHRPTDCPRS